MRYFSNHAMSLYLSKTLLFCTNNQGSNATKDSTELDPSFVASAMDILLTVDIFSCDKARNAFSRLKDIADYPADVWTLPPSLRSNDGDKSKFEAIGESHYVTILFKLKPAL